MNISLFKRLAVPLLLLPLMALWVPGAGANAIEDGDGRIWQATYARNGAHFQVRVEVSQGAEPAFTFWATSGATNSIDPFLFTDGSQVWVTWSQERLSIDGTYDIFLRQIYLDGTVDEPASQVTKANDAAISDRTPCGAVCPLGFHVAFKRETSTPARLAKSICYLNNIPGDGSSSGLWIDAEMECIPIIEDHDGTEPTLLLGNGDNGSPTMVVFKDWITVHILGEGSKKKSSCAIWERVLSSSDPNPWERVLVHLPLNP